MLFIICIVVVVVVIFGVKISLSKVFVISYQDSQLSHSTIPGLPALKPFTSTLVHKQHENAYQYRNG